LHCAKDHGRIALEDNILLMQTFMYKFKQDDVEESWTGLHWRDRSEINSATLLEVFNELRDPNNPAAADEKCAFRNFNALDYLQSASCIDKKGAAVCVYVEGEGLDYDWDWHCPKDFIAHQGNCFKYFIEPSTYEDAQLSCAYVGATLAAVNNT
ncbi:unnamed protein product, partial [Meganyctiphanes norvegica]